MTRCLLHVLEQLETRLHALVSFGQVVFEKEMSARSQTFGVRVDHDERKSRVLQS